MAHQHRRESVIQVKGVLTGQRGVSSLSEKTYLAIQNVNGLEPLLLRHPVFYYLAVISVEVGIKKIKIRPSVSLDELIDHFGLEIILERSAPRLTAGLVYEKPTW